MASNAHHVGSLVWVPEKGVTLCHTVQGGGAMASNAHHVGSLVWVPEKGVDGTLFRSKKVARWVRGRVAALRPGADGQPALEVATEEGAVHVLPPGEAPLQNERDDTVDDLVKSDFLHEPGCGWVMGFRG